VDGVVDPEELLGTERLVLLAGGFAGFEERCRDRYEAVATCFFIDVVEDLVGTIELIYRILKPGGCWINIGPMMLHHGSDEFFSTSTLEDVVSIARGSGFQIVKEDRVETTYIAHPTAHIRTLYRCKLMVGRK
jgi:carnosine N-methyltransferase